VKRQKKGFRVQGSGLNARPSRTLNTEHACLRSAPNVSAALRTPEPRTLSPEPLLAAARAAARNAYCPYSRFAVGAALLADDGRLFTGANVENASFGLTLCAERAALVAAVSAGARTFRALAVAGGSRTPAMPCGACRQVLAEFCPDAMPIFYATRGNRGAIRCTTLGRLLPDAFRLQPSLAATETGSGRQHIGDTNIERPTSNVQHRRTKRGNAHA